MRLTAIQMLEQTNVQSKVSGGDRIWLADFVVGRFGWLISGGCGWGYVLRIAEALVGNIGSLSDSWIWSGYLSTAVD